ncbi:MAG TPA: glycosyltransferase family 9 protein [Ignavibacteriaceae bacterium]|nr:glycosyltransferase family 9 protein [Ignavibacteriaceae bacterium]
MKILILALSGIGDALMFTPALELMRNELPDAQIDALVMYKGVREMYDRNPDFNNIFYFDFLKEGIVNSFKYVSGLRHKYDASINVYPSNRKEYNLINFLISSEKRVGIKYLRKDSQNLGDLNNVRILENDFTHNVQSNIKLVEKLLGKKFDEEPPLKFPLIKEDENFALKFISDKGIKNTNILIGFHPGSAILKNHIKRRWEPEKFAELGKLLIEQKNAKILIFGGPEENDLKANINGLISSSDSFIIDSGNLAESAALMAKCNLFVSNDSSLMHVASALKLKVVAILGPTNPHYIHPWKTEHIIVRLDLDCSPCFIYSPRPLICFRDDIKFKCIKELTVEMVYNASVKLMG